MSEAMSKPGTAVAITPQGMGLLEAIRQPEVVDRIKSLAPRGTEPAHFAAALELALSQNEYLQKATPDSVMKCVLLTAQTGLEIGRTAHLVPFKDTKSGAIVATFVPDYKGLIQLAMQGSARFIEAKVVREGDLFEYEFGTNARLRHVPLHSAKGAITHAWALARVKHQETTFVVLTRDEIEAVRSKHSKQWNQSKAGPLENVPWYAQKTAIRQLCKHLPQIGPKLYLALKEDAERDELTDDGEIPLADYEVVQDQPTAPTRTTVSPAPPEAPLPPDAEELEAPTMTLRDACAYQLPGKAGSKAWGGKAGVALMFLRNSLIESALEWARAQANAEDGYRGAEDLATALSLVLEARKSGVIAEPPKEPKAPKDEPVGASASLSSEAGLPF